MKLTITHIILALLLLIAAVGLAILPQTNNKDEVSADLLLEELNDQTRFLSTDQVAKIIIDQDPSILLVDVRSPKEFAAFTLPGAMNIPFENLLEDEYAYTLKDVTRSIVLFSNGDIKAEQAWLLCKRMGLNHLHIMKGGLNCWAETILMPIEPPQTAPAEDHNLYQARLGAKQYFTGVNPVIPAKPEAKKEAIIPAKKEEKQTEVIVPVKKEKQTVIEGGC